MSPIKRIAAVCLAASVLALGACVDQHPEQSGGNEDERLIATSNATLWICDALGLELVGRCSTYGDIPQRYAELPEVGTAMSPDTEAIVMLEPTDVIGPDTLAETIEPTYAAADIPYTFIKLQSVDQMYESIALLGDKYGKQAEAKVLTDEYEKTMSDFEKSIEGKPRPKVLVLMGLPGAYIECTPNSYVGSLVELAGAESAVQVEDNMNFVSWNTEALLELDPDIILLTAHGMPDMAMEMFAKEFAENDIWRHFRAVREGRVYRLDYSLFGMSCTFEWPEALEILKEMLYDGSYESFVKGETP